MSRRYVLVLVASLMVVGCGAPAQDQLQQWMQEQHGQVNPRVKPIAAPKQFKPEIYQQAGDFDPFSNQKLMTALKKDAAQRVTNDALLTPELARRKQPLEEFPLDTMTMVGSLSKNGQPVALVLVGKLLYQVRAGEYLGQDYGKVLKVSETQLALREIVQDATGEWVERAATLQLQERSR